MISNNIAPLIEIWAKDKGMPTFLANLLVDFENTYIFSNALKRKTKVISIAG
jgi:hypothetical protein